MPHGTDFSDRMNDSRFVFAPNKHDTHTEESVYRMLN